MTFQMLKKLLLVGALFAVAACSTTAPLYQPNFSSVNMLKNSDLSDMRVGDVTMAHPDLEKVTIRGGTMNSPYQNSYAGYYKYAIEEQLKQASLWNKDSNIVVACVVERNTLDGSGMSTGFADLAARFTVNQGGKEIYNKEHSIHNEWASSFMGMIAIPNAMQGYQASVQKLVDAFFSDPDLLKVIGKK